MPELCAVSRQPFLDESPSVLFISSDHFCFTQMCDCGWCYFLCIGGWDALLLPYWNFFPPSSVRCLPSFDLSYFCCVPRGMNSPSINISIVISAGRLRVTFRKMSWNWFLTFISQSGWGLFLAGRVSLIPWVKLCRNWKVIQCQRRVWLRFSVAWWHPQAESCVQGEPFPLVTPFSSTLEWLTHGGELQVLKPAWRWELWCHLSHVLGALVTPRGHPPPWRLWRGALSDAGVRMQQGSVAPNWLMWHSWSSLLSLSVLKWLLYLLQCCGALIVLQQMLYFILNAVTS